MNRFLTFLAAVFCTGGVMFAQQTHQLYPSGMPPGGIGLGAVVQKGPIQGYYQPVKVILPEGCQVAFAQDGYFFNAQEVPVQVGLLVGNVYRFQITQIPFNAESELYPSIELIDRTYAPIGREFDFPIEIELTQEDLELAIQGRFIMRIIYLESPFTAVPTQGEERAKLMMEVGSGENSLDLATAKGRPMAIVRLGNRIIDERSGHDLSFFFGNPPWIGTD